MKKVFLFIALSLMITGCGEQPTYIPDNTDYKDFDSAYFESAAFFYDGSGHILDTVKGIPDGTTVTYQGRNSYKELGEYPATATLKKDGYHDKTLTATLRIIDYSTMVDIDDSNEAYTFGEILYWDDVFNALLGRNYTLKMYSGNRTSEDAPFDFKEGDSYTIVACDGTDGYYRYHSTYSTVYDTYTFYNVIGDDAIIHEFNINGTGSNFVSKFPAKAMDESFIKRYPAKAFCGLQKGEGGLLIPGIDLDDYYGDKGTYEVRDNHLVIKLEHTRSGDYIYRIFEFYNVGNTKVYFPDSLYPSSEEIESINMTSDRFIIDGIQYGNSLVSTWNSPTEYMAHSYLYYWQQLILEPGPHFVYPAIYDKVVQRVVYAYYSEVKIYNLNMSGYELNLCFDKNGNYQGEYEKYGTVTDRTSNFVSHGGVVHYYDEWNQ